jgi:MFS family permease
MHIFRDMTPERRTLWVTSLIHVWNDAFFALLYPLLPLIAADLSLSYTQTGLLRTLFSGAASIAQLPATFAATQFGEFLPLILGNMWVAGGLVGMGLAPAYGWLLAASVLGGLGGGPQHPLGSSLISRVYDRKGRTTAIGTLNFAGDVGKLAGPALIGLLVVVCGWRSILVGAGILGFGAMLLLGATRRTMAVNPVGIEKSQAHERPSTERVPRHIFATMTLVGVLDSATRGAALTFLPFVLVEKGLSEGSIGGLFTLLFAGGAAGKLVCGWLGDRMSSLSLIWATKGLVAILLILFFVAPVPALAPLVLVFGFGLNGTSSVLYASVARFLPLNRRARGYGFYFTFTQGASAASPVLYGLVADVGGLANAMIAMSLVSLVILPASLALRSYLR